MSTIAIDFGTSNTIVAYVDPVTQQPRTMEFGSWSRSLAGVMTVPTLLVVQPEGVAIGEEVRSQRLGMAQPDRYFAMFKRDLVADFQPPDRVIDGQTYPIEAVAERFLTALWAAITAQVQPTQVILTVPTGAFEPYLTWFRGVADRLNWPNPVWLDEATAAALGYAAAAVGDRHLVVDCGGGTVDLSLVRTIAPQVGQTLIQAEVLAKSDAAIGGVDVDIWLVEDYLRRNGMSRSTISPVSWQTLLEMAERLKIRLSVEDLVKDSWFDDELLMAYELQFDRAQFAEILETQQFLEQLRQAIDEVLTIAFDQGIQKSDIDRVLLVGGSSQIPAVQQLVVAYFGRSRVKLDQPLVAVAYGALALAQVSAIQDQLRHGYAIRLWDPDRRDHQYFPLFEAGTRYPCDRAEALTLQVAIEGQTEIRLDLGECAMQMQAEVIYDATGRLIKSQLNRASAFRSIGAGEICVARLEPPGQLGVDRVVVQFAVTAARMLVVTVRDLVTQQVLVDGAMVAQLV